MAVSEVISIAVSGILGGGVIAGLAQILASRNEARRLRLMEKESAHDEEMDDSKKVSIVVEAAERSVASLNLALSRAEQEIARLEKTIAALQIDLNDVRDKYIALQADMYQIQQRAKNLGKEVTND